MRRPMLNLLRRWRDGPDRPPASVGEGRRVYAIGDIHGRLDLLDRLLETIAADHEQRGAGALCLILLGDLIDRGPQSAQVIARARALRQAGEDVRLVKGNHEEVFLLAARGDAQAVRLLRRAGVGGMDTLASYGLPPAAAMTMDDAALARWMLAHIPREDVDFVEDFVDRTDVGDYLFVHAGIRPHVAIDAQRPADLRWIRSEFLGHQGMHDKIVVHGHSITPEVDERANRIGIDTGAYASGRLTAIGLEGTQRWFLQTGAG